MDPQFTSMTSALHLSSTSTSTSECSNILDPATNCSSWGQSQSLSPYPSTTLSTPLSSDTIDADTFVNGPLAMVLASKKPLKHGEHIPRPPNSFILFRRDRVKKHGKMRAGELSKVIAKEWREAPHEVREHYIKRAKIEAVEHAKAFPNYRFTPVKRDGTKRGERAARQVRDALGYIPGSSLDFSSAMILGSHMKQEAPGFVRISHSLPYCTQRKKASQKSKKSSKSAKIKSDVFSLDSSLSVLSSSKNSKVTHPFYTQTKAVTAPQNLLFLSSHSQAPVFHFIPSTPAKFPSSVSTGASSLVSFSNGSSYINSQTEDITLPSQSNEKVSPTYYMNQLLSANFSVAMNLNPPSVPSTQELNTSTSFYPQPVTSEIDYQRFISSGLPCPIPKSALTFQGHRASPANSATPLLSPVMSECSSYSSEMSLSLVQDRNESFMTEHRRQMNIRDKSQSDMTTQQMNSDGNWTLSAFSL